MKRWLEHLPNEVSDVKGQWWWSCSLLVLQVSVSQWGIERVISFKRTSHRSRLVQTEVWYPVDVSSERENPQDACAAQSWEVICNIHHKGQTAHSSSQPLAGFHELDYFIAQSIKHVGYILVIKPSHLSSSFSSFLTWRLMKFKVETMVILRLLSSRELALDWWAFTSIYAHKSSTSITGQPWRKLHLWRGHLTFPTAVKSCTAS